MINFESQASTAPDKAKEEAMKGAERLEEIRAESNALYKEMGDEPTDDQKEQMSALNQEADELVKEPGTIDQFMEKAFKSPEFEKMVRAVVLSTMTAYGEGAWPLSVELEDNKIILKVKERKAGFAKWNKSNMEEIKMQIAQEMSKRVINVSDISSEEMGKKTKMEPLFPFVVPTTQFEHMIEIEMGQN